MLQGKRRSMLVLLTSVLLCAGQETARSIAPESDPSGTWPPDVVLVQMLLAWTIATIDNEFTRALQQSLRQAIAESCSMKLNQVISVHATLP